MDLRKTDEGWAAKSKGRTVPGTKAPTKAESVKKTAGVARRSTDPVTVKIHKANGEFEEERTYPRSADPRKSKG